MRLLERQLLASEVVQTSAMDCGPAALKSLLDGFGIAASYGELRDACQTDLDGTSIDTLETLAGQLGLKAEQVMVPPDHLLLPGARALPAIVLVRHPTGGSHFVVVWRRHGAWLQVMDPAAGRCWLKCERFLDALYLHRYPVAAAEWRSWGGSPEFLDPLRHRLRGIGQPTASARQLVLTALEDPAWRSLAALDAATRLVASLQRAGGLRRGAQAAAICERFFERAAQEDPGDAASVPPANWTVRPVPTRPGGEPRLMMHGAVLVSIRGRARAPFSGPSPRTAASGSRRSRGPSAARRRGERSPGRVLLGLMRDDGLLNPALLVGALLLSAGGRLLEALLLRGLLDFSEQLELLGQRLLLLGVMLAFACGLLVLELPIASGLLRLGRRHEIRLRRALYEKIPRLGSRYFGTRLTSDLAQRSHALHRLRQLAGHGGQFLRACAALALTTLGVAWLHPAGTPLALGIAAAAAGIPLVCQPFLLERDLRFRTLGGALSRHYLDALLGLMPIRSHSAGRALRREHEALLADWGRAGLRLQAGQVLIQALQLLLTWGLAAWLLLDHLLGSGSSSGSLLLIYWVLTLPRIGQEVATLACQYPRHRNVTLRLLEPLEAPEEEVGGEEHRPSGPAAAAGGAVSSGSRRGVSIAMRGVEVRAAGRPLLLQIDLDVAPGSRVAIVGPSGAGKSTLVGLLLGWRQPSAGRLLVDGAPLDAAAVARLRPATAWIDPGVRLWNRSLYDNVRYGASGSAPPLTRLIDAAELETTLESLPEGMQTRLGEGGALVSGGEGQQVRLARGLARPNARLVILDEPFRGLDRERRRRLLSRCRSWWPDATLLCVTHDVGDTVDFDRILVVERGRIVEQGSPSRLAAQADSRFHRLLRAERAAREELWSGRRWRRLWLVNGELAEDRCSSVA